MIVKYGCLQFLSKVFHCLEAVKHFYLSRDLLLGNESLTYILFVYIETGFLPLASRSLFDILNVPGGA